MAIPCLDLSDFTSKSVIEKQKFVNDLGFAFENIGFVAIKSHGLSNELTEKLYSGIKQFFDLPDEIKSKYDIEGVFGQRGYTGKRKENAKGRNVGDLKEFFHFGQTNIPVETDLALHYPKNVIVGEIDGLMNTGNEVFQVLENTAIQLLRAIALYLKLEENYFDLKVNTGNSILRAIHYFPILNEKELAHEAVRAAAHEDINLITLLIGASADGLQIQKIDGSWHAVTALPNQIVVNVGDMLSRLTNDKLVSTTHRVVNPPKELWHLPRYSIPFFMHPRSDVDLSCLPSCVSETNPKKYSDINAGQFLDERLREIGLKK